MAQTKIILCNCPSEYQDKKYGRFKRLANGAPKAKAWRCTVCGKLIPAADAPRSA